MTDAELPLEQTRRSGSAADEDGFDVDQAFGADDLHAIRSTVAAHASRLGAPTAQIEALVIVASELATNAIRHGGGGGQLRLWHRGRTLYCQVSDQGPGMADVSVGSQLPTLQATAGRGMWIVRRISSELRIELGVDSRGATITATIAHPTDTP
jgi:anti-sigma regulatory factor (Ser/Thr protein kinase)